MLYRFRRWARKEWNRRLHSVDRRKLDATLEAIGVTPGTVVCVHSTLTGLAHFVGGPEMIIDALKSAVGPRGAVLMASFATGGAAVDLLDQGAVFDVRRTPSRVGLLTEVFRQSEGVTRSLHPTNSVAGWGERAGDIIKDHDKSETAYGDETPYGRLARLDDGYVLMLGTHVQSLLHHIQERIDFPNLLLPDARRAEVIDRDGRARVLHVRVMRSRIPYFVAIPAARGPSPTWAILHDFCLMFERNREKLVKAAGYDLSGYPRLFERRRELEAQGILRSTRLGKGNVGLLHAKQYVAYLEPEFREMIGRFKADYDLERIEALKLQYM